MAAVVVQSRFAGLKIEDDEYPSSGNDKGQRSKLNNGKKSELIKKSKNNNKAPSANKKKKSKQNIPSSDQWELWKKKDEQLVDGNYECELQEAILLSKLDYEEKKDVYKHFKKQAEVEKKSVEQSLHSTTTKKQKKKNVMSLDQFNDMMNCDETKLVENGNCVIEDQVKSPDKDTEFFERIEDDTKNELLKDKTIDRVKKRQAISEEVITRVQFADALERKDREIAGLKQEIISLKQELLTVKCRNKKLCNILGQGEMKDKAEVLVEVERLRAVQTELTAELAALHTNLEKERSKNTDPRAKDKKKRSSEKDK